jgi:hypothetical protein
MRLADLEPRWFDVPGIGATKDGVTFLCPCAMCLQTPEKQVRLAAQFANPVDGPPRARMSLDETLWHVHELRTFDVPPGFLWQRTGVTFETLTLSPSVDASASGHWHGFVTHGECR